MSPPFVDPQLLNGMALTKQHRSTALQLYDAQTSHPVHIVYDVSQDLQIIAITNTASAQLNLATARAGSRLLTMTGEALNTELLKCGLLENMLCASTGHTMTCTRLSRVNAMFQAVQYVHVRTIGMMPWPLHMDPVCTCPGFARYGGCEHVEFTKMLDRTA